MTSATIHFTPNDQQLLRETARKYVADYPDLHDMARRAAQRIIFKRTGKRLDPGIGSAVPPAVLGRFPVGSMQASRSSR